MNLLKSDFINDISSLSRVVFSESPAYWSVRDALNKSKEVRKTGDLTGVSKYPSVDRLVSSSSKETSSDMLAIWKFSCNSFFKVSSNSSTYLSFPFVKLNLLLIGALEML
jgi:hypothetical protein